MIWALNIQKYRTAAFCMVWGSSHTATIKFKLTLRCNWCFYYSNSSFQRHTDPPTAVKAVHIYPQWPLSGVTHWQLNRSLLDSQKLHWMFADYIYIVLRVTRAAQSLPARIQALLTLLLSSLSHSFSQAGLQMVLLVIDTYKCFLFFFTYSNKFNF